MMSGGIKENEPLEGEVKSLFKTLDVNLSHSFALSAGFLYAVGYLINAITLRNYGIHRFEAVKLQYVEVGLTFTVLSCAITVVPSAAAYTHFIVRSRSGLLYPKVGAVLYLLNTCNLFLLVTFFAIFIAGHDWAMRAELGWVELPLGTLFSFFYLPIAVFSLTILPLVERRFRPLFAGSNKRYWLWVGSLKASAVLCGIAFDYLLFTTLPWMWDLVLRGWAYLATIWLFTSVLAAIVFWLKKVGRVLNMYPLTFLGGLGMMCLLYVCINAYVWGVVRFIPMNRGGKLPVTEVYLSTADPEVGPLLNSRLNAVGRASWGPAYILEESTDFTFLASDEERDWCLEWVPIIGVGKQEISVIYHKRISRSPRDR